MGKNFENLVLLLVAINLFGFAAGLYFYYPQLMGANPIFWIFIPDCPLYVLLAGLFYLKIIKGDLLRMITAAGLLKYGAWTLFALFYYPGYFLTDWFGWLLVIEHIGMSLQFLLLAKVFDRKFAAIAILWFLLNDYVDYALGMHPFIPSANLGAVAGFAVAGSLLAPLAVYLIGNWLEKSGLRARAWEMIAQL